MLNCCWCIAVFKTDCVQTDQVNRMICIGWDIGNHLAVKKNKLELVKDIISRMFTNHMYSLTSHVCNYLTMCKWIIDVGLNCWCCIAAMLGAVSFVCRQVGSGSFGILSTKYSFVNLRFNMCGHCVACRGFYAIKSTKPNQTREHFESSKKPHSFTEIWPNKPFH